MATQLKDGRWQARHRPKTGQAMVWYGETDEDAERQKAEYLDELRNPNRSIPLTAEMTVQEFAKRAWWPRVESTAKDTTVKKYDDTWRLHVRPVFGALPLSQVDYVRVQRWIADMRKARKIVDEKSVPAVSNNEIRFRRSVLSMVLNLAVKQRLIDRNPAADAAVPAKPKRVRVMTIDQAIEVLRATDGTNMAAPVFCGLILGMGRGEAAGQRWVNIDFKERRVTVLEQRRRIRIGAYEIAQTDPKRVQRVRSFVLPPELFDMLLRLGNQDSGWVCTSRGNRPWNPEKLTEKWAEIAPGLGLEGWTFHDLRHATAGLLVALGVDLLTIAAILGHGSIDTTMLYAAVQENSASKGLEVLAKALFPVENRPPVASIDAI